MARSSWLCNVIQRTLAACAAGMCRGLDQDLFCAKEITQLWQDWLGHCCHVGQLNLELLTGGLCNRLMGTILQLDRSTLHQSQVGM